MCRMKTRINLKKACGVSLICSWLFFAAWPDVTSQAKTLVPIEEVVSALEEEPIGHDFDQIIKNIWAAIYDDPYNYEYYGILAMAYDEIGDYQSELEALKLAVKYLPDDFKEKGVHYGNLARAYLLNDQWELGKKWLDKADETSNRNFYNRCNEFSYYTKYHFDAKQAAAQLSILDHMTGSVNDYFYEGLNRVMDLEDMTCEQISAIFEEAVKQNPGNAKAALRTFGAALRYQALFEKDIPTQKANELMRQAIALMRQTIKLDPAFIPSYITLSNAYLLDAKKNDKPKLISKALHWIKQARIIEPDYQKLDYVEGNIYLANKEYQKAAEYFNKSIDNGSDDEDILYRLVLAYQGMANDIYRSGENLDQGLDIIDRAVALSPENGYLHSIKAELLYKLGLYAEALPYIEVGIEQYPQHTDIQRCYQMITEALGANSVTAANR